MRFKIVNCSTTGEMRGAVFAFDYERSHWLLCEVFDLTEEEKDAAGRCPNRRFAHVGRFSNFVKPESAYFRRTRMTTVLDRGGNGNGRIPSDKIGEVFTWIAENCQQSKWSMRAYRTKSCYDDVRSFHFEDRRLGAMFKLFFG